MNICTSIVVIFVNKALKMHGGDLNIGAYGVINRVVMLFIMIVLGLNQGMQPIVGYNYGAKQYDRVLKALGITLACAVGVTTAGFLISRFLPREVAMLFVGGDSAESKELIEAVTYGMKNVMVMFWLVGFQVVTGNFFQYIGKPKRAIIISLTRQMIFLVPLLMILPSKYGVLGVWLSMPIADSMSAILAAIFLVLQVRNFRREMAERR
jgi:Na+-driven multidrug efflux pump